MNLNTISDQVLHQNTIQLAGQERQVTAEILHHLREISERRLYAVMGYSSLWEYCIKELKYSEASAHRRISTMRLMAQIPEVEQKIQDGALSLSAVSQVQSACRTKPELRLEMLKAVEGKSKRETEKILATVTPRPATAEKEKSLNDKETEVRFVMTDELEKKLGRVKVLTSNRQFKPSYAELIEMMADIVLERLDPEKKVTKKVAAAAASKNKINSRKPKVLGGIVSAETSPPPAKVSSGSPRLQLERQSEAKQAAQLQSRYIRVDVRRALHQRSGSRCEFTSFETGRRCEETKRLEIDHYVVPFGRGGNNELENLRLVCATHNRLHAIQTYGQEKMGAYFSK